MFQINTIFNEHPVALLVAHASLVTFMLVVASALEVSFLCFKISQFKNYEKPLCYQQQGAQEKMFFFQFTATHHRHVCQLAYKSSVTTFGWSFSDQPIAAHAKGRGRKIWNIRQHPVRFFFKFAFVETAETGIEFLYNMM